MKTRDRILDVSLELFNQEGEASQTAVDIANALDMSPDTWAFVHLALEETHDLRFFYRNVGDMMERYPGLASRFRKVLAMKRQAIENVLSQLEKQGFVTIDRRLRSPLLQQMLSTLTFWLSHDLIEGGDRDGPNLIHDTVLQFMLLIVPYMGDAGAEALDGMLERRREFTKA